MSDRKSSEPSLVSSKNPMFGYESDDAQETEQWKKHRRWKRVMNGQQRRKREMEAFAKRYFTVKDTKKANRTIDKLVFVATVALMVFSASCVASPLGRAFIPYSYLISMPFLIILRWFQYRKQNSHYFLLDWCYWINLLCLIYLVALQDKGILFGFLFTASLGPLAWTVIVYRNSLVFHSIDKFTSFFIHMAPPTLLYTLRWYPEDSARLWWAEFNTSVEEDVADAFDLDELPSDISLAIGFPLFVIAMYAIQQGAQNIFLNYCVKKSCTQRCFHFNPDTHMTLYSYSANTGSGIVFKLIHACGPKHRLLMWYLSNLLYTSLVVIPTFFWYRYQMANAIFLSFCFVWGTYNGSTFYIEVFSRKYAYRRSVRRPEPDADQVDDILLPQFVGSAETEADTQDGSDDVESKNAHQVENEN